MAQVQMSLLEIEEPTTTTTSDRVWRALDPKTRDELVAAIARLMVKAIVVVDDEEETRDE